MSGAVLTDRSATGFIVDEEGPKSVRFADAYTTEGASNTKALTFTVALSQAAETGAPVSVNYATANATALASGNDYVATSGTVTFNAGESVKTVTVTVRGDTTVEANETFAVNLSGLSGDGAVLADSQGIGTLVNDDGTAGASPPPTPRSWRAPAAAGSSTSRSRCRTPAARR